MQDLESQNEYVNEKMRRKRDKIALLKADKQNHGSER